MAEHPEKNFAAIAPRTAAAEYGLKVAASDIQEMEENYTRFWILGHEVPELELAKTGDKQTLALTLPDNLPGPSIRLCRPLLGVGLT
ncbi:hypothetical protein HGP05_08540 [Streptococcus sanguinis]|uniref:Prephenate dehydratase domain-containing protein n=1 Tax=Streptococcus sanguinis TaxID=1305 RepID=A0A7Y0VBF6_STRSA|nr:hypothetical protein [Streptococcus sanguinis]